MSKPPLPPVDLANRVGQLVGADGSYAAYEKVGREIRDVVVAAVPADWTWQGKRVLDFGCGAGRTLRHFLVEAAEAEFWGCDIHASSIEWVNANLSPPVRAFVNSERPPLPRPDHSFDLIYAFSVFTHITDAWSAWLLELHRLLAPGGLLVASFLGAGMSEPIAGEPWEEQRIGMNVLRATTAGNWAGRWCSCRRGGSASTGDARLRSSRCTTTVSRTRTAWLSLGRGLSRRRKSSSSASTRPRLVRSRRSSTTSGSCSGSRRPRAPRPREPSRRSNAAAAGGSPRPCAGSATASAAGRSRLPLRSAQPTTDPLSVPIGGVNGGARGDRSARR